MVFKPFRRGPDKMGGKEESKRMDLPRSYQSAVAAQLAKEADDLYRVLEANNLRNTTFQGGDAPYLFSKAVSGEHVVQCYFTNDPCLKDVLVDSKSIKDENPAWFALTTHRLGVGRVSKNWREQLALWSHKYDELTGSKYQAEGNRLRIEAPGGVVEVVFDPQVKQEVLAAFQGFIERKRAQQTVA